MRVIGDIHGNLAYYRDVIKGHAESIQVGDFGVGFAPFQELLELDEKEPYHRFYRGNHDDPSFCKELKRYLGPGRYKENGYIYDGAWSIDSGIRTPGWNWWAEEEHTIAEGAKLASEYALLKPETMFSHDCPTSVAYHMFLKGNTNTTQFLNITNETLQGMFEKHQPKRWIFGHWHISKELVIEGCRFICVGKNQYKDIDL
jgi:hypothetical protein